MHRDPRGNSFASTWFTYNPHTSVVGSVDLIATLVASVRLYGIIAAFDRVQCFCSRKSLRNRVANSVRWRNGDKSRHCGILVRVLPSYLGRTLTALRLHSSISGIRLNNTLVLVALSEFHRVLDLVVLMSLTHVHSHTLLRLCYHAHLRNRILLEPTIALRVIHTVPCQPLCRCVRIYPRFLAVFHGVLPTCEYAIWAVISCADVLAAEVSLVFPDCFSSKLVNAVVLDVIGYISTIRSTRFSVK